ncbi:MAG: hypothetical protein Fur0043_16340 [Anaerolineales bacterium]
MRILTAGVAIAFGLLVLAGYLFPSETLLQLRLLLVQWAVILAATAVLVGAFNLLQVHWKKIRTKRKDSTSSALLIIALVFSASFGLALGPHSDFMRSVLEAVIVPAEASLMALLTVTLVYASIRLFRRRADMMSVIFLAIAIFALLAAAPLPIGTIPLLSDIQFWFIQPFASGGTRGLLLGVALGSLTAGLRVLFSLDRPYGGK